MATLVAALALVSYSTAGLRRSGRDPRQRALPCLPPKSSMRVSRPAHNLFTAVARGTCRRTQPRAIVGKLDGDAEKRARAAARLNPRRFGGDREGPAGQLPAAIVFSSSISAARLSPSRANGYTPHKCHAPLE